MKRLLDTSKTIRTRLTRNAKSSDGRKWGEPEVAINSEIGGKNSLKRSSSTTEMYRKCGENDERLAKMEQNRTYWNLKGDQNRKIVDPVYIKQAIHDTFMQRAHGAYRYTKPPTFPQHTSVSHKATFAGNQKSRVNSENGRKMKAIKPLPFNVDGQLTKTRSMKKKMLTSSGKGMRQISGKIRENSLENSKELALIQLEAARNKLSDAPRTTSVGDKRNFKSSKDKYRNVEGKEGKIPVLSSLIESNKEKRVSTVSDNIAITPRTIAVKKMTELPNKSTKMSLDVFEEHAHKRPGFATGKSQMKNARLDKKKPVPTPQKSVKPVKTQTEEDRLTIWNAMKSGKSTSEQQKTVQTTTPNRRRQMRRDFDLTPQIYPKGSLSLKKSYLPIPACRSIAVRKTGPGAKICAQSTPVPKDLISVQDAERKLRHRERGRRSITAHIVESIKSLLCKIRPSETR